jgi:hypothetical protein
LGNTCFPVNAVRRLLRRFRQNFATLGAAAFSLCPLMRQKWAIRYFWPNKNARIVCKATQNFCKPWGNENKTTSQPLLFSQVFGIFLGFFLLADAYRILFQKILLTPCN